MYEEIEIKSPDEYFDPKVNGKIYLFLSFFCSGLTGMKPSFPFVFKAENPYPWTPISTVDIGVHALSVKKKSVENDLIFRQ